MSKLGLARVPTPLSDFIDKESGSWLKPVFGSLKAFAIKEGRHVLGVRDVARYFGGQHHIEGMIRKAYRSNIGILLGYDAGLVLDVLLPLTEGEYRNGPWRLDVGDFVIANPEKPGTPCYHRGLVVNIELLPEDVLEILEEQRNSKEFAEAMNRLQSPIMLPEEYLEALRLSCT
jgi:hypothetical protein